MRPEDERLLKLCLIEDHVAVRDAIAAYLATQPDFTIVGQSTDGRNAVSDCFRLRPDIVLLDVVMPGLSGIEIAEQLDAVDLPTRILAFTGHFDPATVRRLLEVGVAGIVENSAAATVLIDAVRAVARGQSYFSDQVTEQLRRLFGEPRDEESRRLSAREEEVLRAVAQGFSNKEVAVRLGISVKTVENHRHRIMAKTGARNAADLTRLAYGLGLLPPPDRSLE